MKPIRLTKHARGYSVSHFLAIAAGEKLAVMLTMDYLRAEASAGRREDFDRYLAAVPDVPPARGDELKTASSVREKRAKYKAR